MPPSNELSRVACLNCRQRHLKCDAQDPCSRCQSQQVECVYAGSRRGYRGAKRLRSDDEPYNTSCDDVDGAFGGLQSNRQDPPLEDPLLDLSTRSEASTNRQCSTQTAEVKLYYQNFHPAHPILPSLSDLQNASHYPTYIFDVIDFVGAHFTHTRQTRLLDDWESRLLSSLRSVSSSVLIAQAKLVMTIVLHSRGNEQESLLLLDETTTQALALIETVPRAPGSRNSHDWNLEGDEATRSSIQKLWWELYLVDGILSALHARPTLRTAAASTSMYLPGAPNRMTLQSFQQRYFYETSQHFPAAWYRIEAIHILGQVLNLSDDSKSEDEFADVDALLVAWPHHLPDDRHELLDATGGLDQALFQAHMVIHFAEILLHLPRSHLYAAKSSQVTCLPKVTSAAPSTFTSHTHAVRATKAANEITRLASLPVDSLKHTPFWICSLVLGSMVQLSACCANGSCKCLTPHRHRIIQAIGLLKTLEKIWRIAEYTLRQVRAIANEIMSTGWVQPAEACELDMEYNARLLDDASFNDDLTHMFAKSADVALDPLDFGDEASQFTGV